MTLFPVVVVLIFVADFQALEDLVEAEKAKKEKKSEPPKAKKTAKKSG